MDKIFKPKNNEINSTIGIDIHPFKEKGIEFNVFDFAGQLEYQVK